MGKGKKPEMAEVVGAQHCKCDGCKKPESKFTFCNEHYEWFKFGLITKMGKKVGDFDKKHDHYMAYLDRQKAYKVA
jgi:hypothetical protein